VTSLKVKPDINIVLNRRLDQAENDAAGPYKNNFTQTLYSGQKCSHRLIANLVVVLLGDETRLTKAWIVALSLGVATSPK
jgi:hypothetical protein